MSHFRSGKLPPLWFLLSHSLAHWKCIRWPLPLLLRYNSRSASCPQWKVTPAATLLLSIWDLSNVLGPLNFNLDTTTYQSKEKHTSYDERYSWMNITSYKTGPFYFYIGFFNNFVARKVMYLNCDVSHHAPNVDGCKQLHSGDSYFYPSRNIRITLEDKKGNFIRIEQE